MANTKNFKVNSGIKPTAYHENVGTVTSGTAAVGYNLAGASYDSVSFDISGQEGGAFGLAFNNDGTKMYVTGYTSDAINQYSLSTAFDLSTASYDSVQFSFLSQDTTPISAMFNNDGTKIYVVGRTNLAIFQYSLSTAFDVSTTSYDSVSFSVSSQDSSPYNIDFNSDGTKMYLVGDTNNAIYQYSLSTGFDLSTASYDSVSLTVTSQDGSPYGIRFKPDGTKLYMVGVNNKTIYQYSLSTAFDLSTASYDSVSFSVNSQETLPTNLVFNNNGTKMYVVGYSGDNVYQYTTSSTIAAKTLDMSTGTVFEITPTADTQIGLSNPAASGTVSQATLLLDGTTLSFNTSGIEQLSGTLSVGSYETATQGMFIGDSGTKLYFTGTAGDDVNQFNLSTAWDISTGGFSTRLVTSSQDNQMRSLWFKTDGTKMFMVGTQNDRVYEYTLSTAWAVNTASYGSDFLSVGSQDGNMYGMCFDTSGTRMYLGGVDNKRIYQYTLSTAWDITTASYDSSYYQLDTGVGIGDLAISSDGTKFAVTDYSNDKLLVFSFGTAYSISTLSASSDYTFTGIGTGPNQAFYVKPDGTKFYIEGNNTDTMYQYSFEGTVAITYDDSINFSGGTAPTSPAGDETDVLTFTTRDGGTTYSGILAIDGAK